MNNLQNQPQLIFLNLKTRQLQKLIWIENHGYWIHQCLLCQKVELERKTND